MLQPASALQNPFYYILLVTFNLVVTKTTKTKRDVVSNIVYQLGERTKEKHQTQRGFPEHMS